MDVHVLFDARVVARGRISGWERYSLQLSLQLLERSAAIDVFDQWKALYRFVAPWELGGRRWHGYRTIHYPAIPPSRRVPHAQTILTLHDLTWWLYPEHATRLGRSYYRRATERALSYAAAVLVDSNAVRDEVLDRWPSLSERCRVVYPASDHRTSVRAHAPPPTHPSRPYFLFVGTQEPRKNLGCLVKAFEQSGLERDFDLLLVGRLGWGTAPPGVRLLTDVGDHELHALYAGAVATVLPSLYEGFGLPIVESFSHGTPVICTDIPVFQEVSHGRAVAFPTADVDALTECLRMVATSPPDAACRVDLINVAATYTWDRAASEVLAIYQDIDS